MEELAAAVFVGLVRVVLGQDCLGLGGLPLCLRTGCSDRVQWLEELVEKFRHEEEDRLHQHVRVDLLGPQSHGAV